MRFRYNRELLRKLPPLAWETIRDVDRAALGRDDVVPGLTVGIQTHGELANWHPHLHVLVTDGAFTTDGTFIPMPETPAEPYLKLWEKKLFDLLLAEGRITQQVIDQMRTWQHSGFSVDKSVRLDAGDTAFIERRSQPAVVERILKHCGLWEDTAARGPPAATPAQDQLALELQYVDPDEFVTPLTLRCCPSGQPVSRCSALAAL